METRKPDSLQPSYVVIAGQGRSGTNWLLELLDLSSKTYCRNEINKLATSPLAQLPPPAVRIPLDDSFGQEWDRAVAQASLRMGERDSIGLQPKFYLNTGIIQTGKINLLRKRKLRQLLCLIMPSLKDPDFPVPQWFAKHSLLKQALPILKLNQIPSWAEWVLFNRPEALVIHIVRHPAGFLLSWQNRYLKNQDTEMVKQASEERLRQIAQSDPQWAKRLGHIESMTVAQMELWYWCYANEIIYAAGHERPNYLRVIYEELVASPLKTMQSVYSKCCLPWEPNLEEKIAQRSLYSQRIPKVWYERLTEEQTKLVREVLSDTFMAQWWIGDSFKPSQSN